MPVFACFLHIKGQLTPSLSHTSKGKHLLYFCRLLSFSSFYSPRLPSLSPGREHSHAHPGTSWRSSDHTRSSARIDLLRRRGGGRKATRVEGFPAIVGSALQQRTSDKSIMMYTHTYDGSHGTHVLSLYQSLHIAQPRQILPQLFLICIFVFYLQQTEEHLGSHGQNTVVAPVCSLLLPSGQCKYYTPFITKVFILIHSDVCGYNPHEQTVSLY